MAFPIPALFADFTGSTYNFGGNSTGSFFFNGTAYNSLSSWLTAISATVSTPAAYYTNSSGTLALSSPNTLRVDYDPVALTSNGILLEGSSTNLHPHSSISDSVASYSGTTITANASTDPTGASAAASYVPSTSNGSHFLFLSAGIVVSTAVYTWSVFAKANGYNSFRMDAMNVGTDYALFTLSGAGSVTNTGTAVGSITQLANGWYRCVVVAQMTSGTQNPVIYTTGNGSNTVFTGDGSSGYFFWGEQFEALSFATSYIPTTSGTASRSADSFTASVANWYSLTAGTLYAATDTINPSASTETVFGVSGIGGNNAVFLMDGTTGTGALFDVWSGSGESISRLNAGSQSQVAYSVNTLSSAAASLSVSGYLYDKNGISSVASGSVSAMPVGSLTAYFGGGDPLYFNVHYGHINKIGYWSSVFSGSQLQNLTSPNSPIVFQIINTTSTQNLNLPINCVIAGDQPAEAPRKFSVDMFGILKRIFRE